MKKIDTNNQHYPVPFDYAYWVIPGTFLAGYYPGSEQKREAERKLAALLEHGIRQVVNLMEPRELDWYGNLFVPYENMIQKIAKTMRLQIRLSRIPIRDTAIPSRDQMVKILNLIDKSIAEGCPVYVHCLGGLGRTGTVVGCYFARHGIASGKKALAKIQEVRKHAANRHYPSPQFPEQCDMVLSWNEGE